MRTPSSCVITMLFFLMIAWQSTVQAESGTRASHIAIPEDRFEFAPVLEGEEVRHGFNVFNKGASALELREIKPDCGCTTVSYPKLIPAGGKGTIVVKLDTKGFGSEHVTKTITVRTNDPKRPEWDIVVSGLVKPLAVIKPAEAKLTGTAGQLIEQTVTIEQVRENPFRILEARAEKGTNITFTLVQPNKPHAGEYRLIVRNVMPDKGWYMDNIYLKTDSRKSPSLKIRVLGIIRGSQ